MDPTWKIVAYSSVLHLWQPTYGPIMVITYWPNMGNTDGKHIWVPCGSHVGPLRDKTHGYHVENCCILQCDPLVVAHVWPHNGNPRLAQHRQYRWQTHMGPMWVLREAKHMGTTWKIVAYSSVPR